MAEKHAPRVLLSSLADEEGGVVDVALEDDVLAARVDALGAGEGGDGPDERAEELHRDEDGRDGELRLGADVGRPPRGLRRRLEDARDAVRLGQEGAVHGAEAHPHREPERGGRLGEVRRPSLFAAALHFPLHFEFPPRREFKAF